MYKPTSYEQLLTDAFKLLSFLEHEIDVSNGYDVLFVFLDIYENHGIDNIYEPIHGEKYTQFIAEQNKKFCRFDTLGDLPYTRYNIRHGAYSSIVGMMNEFISLKIIKELFNSGEIIQDFDMQKHGHDILYYDNGNKITADVKTSKADWDQEKTVYAHRDWFEPSKHSTRFHVVDIANNKHFIIRRHYFYENFKRYGNYVPIDKLKRSYTFHENDISHITKCFLG